MCLKEVSAYHWIQEAYNAHRTTSKLKWIIKMDDDVIVNPSNLQNVLEKFQNEAEHKTTICALYIDPSPFRNQIVIKKKNQIRLLQSKKMYAQLKEKLLARR